MTGAHSVKASASAPAAYEGMKSSSRPLAPAKAAPAIHAQFSGSDYIDDGYWLAEAEFLKKHGAELVFFPYTESTSSTKLKKLIEKKLL